MGMKDQYQNKADQLKQQAKDRLGQAYGGSAGGSGYGYDEPGERYRKAGEQDGKPGKYGRPDAERPARDRPERIEDEYDV